MLIPDFVLKKFVLDTYYVALLGRYCFVGNWGNIMVCEKLHCCSEVTMGIVSLVT